ncbi:MAG: YggT family protein [Luminiphilus sp.]|nr:YggT family protein [Luminiphilus sp.]MDA0630098.1 YggT family protein [Pseudomonadota bacterium]
MGALQEIFQFLLETLGSLYLCLVVLRTMLQASGADFYNPISQFVVKATQPPLGILRRAIPRGRRFDPALLVLAMVVQAIVLGGLLVLAGYIPSVVQLITWSAVGLIGLVVNTYLIAMVIMIVVSWIAPGSHHPAVRLVYQITEPVMAPVRSLLPAMGGLDFSPIVVFIVINVIQISLRHIAVATGLPTQLVIGI